MKPGESADTFGLNSLVDELLLMRGEFIVNPQRLCVHFGELNVLLFDGFLAGYRACQGIHGFKDERYERFRHWLRDVKEEFPPEGWRTKYLRDCGNDHVRAIGKFLNFAAEFHAMEQRGVC